MEENRKFALDLSQKKWIKNYLDFKVSNTICDRMGNSMSFHGMNLTQKGQKAIDFPFEKTTGENSIFQWLLPLPTPRQSISCFAGARIPTWVAHGVHHLVEEFCVRPFHFLVLVGKPFPLEYLLALLELTLNDVRLLLEDAHVAWNHLLYLFLIDYKVFWSSIFYSLFDVMYSGLYFWRNNGIFLSNKIEMFEFWIFIVNFSGFGFQSIFCLLFDFIFHFYLKGNNVLFFYYS